MDAAQLQKQIDDLQRQAVLDEAKARKDRAKAERTRARVAMMEAADRPLMAFKDGAITLATWQVAKVIAVAGLTIVGVIVAGYLIKEGVRWLLKVVLGDGSITSVEVGDEAAAAVL